jgi:predicted dienelactone hydrolase
MLFTKESLAGLRIPALILRAEHDRINRSPLHAEAIRDALPQTPEYGLITGADSASLMDACPPTVLRDLPELCSRVSVEQRTHIHQQLNTHLSRFLLARLASVPLEEEQHEAALTPESELHIELPPPASPPEGRVKGKKRK